MTLIQCHGCDGKKLVNHIKLSSRQIYKVGMKTKVKECLICKGTGKIDNGIISKN